VDIQAHWQEVYKRKAPDEVSWFEAVPHHSLALIAEAGIDVDTAVIDAGGGESRLAGELLSRGYRDVTVADISPTALKGARDELGGRADQVQWIVADVRRQEFGRRFDLWHDRAAFHFMVDDTGRDRYLGTLRNSLRPGGHLIMATFGPDGPTRCSGLPVHRYGEAELLETLGGEFALVSSRLDMHRTPAGKHQQFLYLHLRREPE
jgi:SAM-dependent methyltransferase